MTTMTDLGMPHPTHAMTAAMMRAVWSRFSPFFERARTNRQARRKLELLVDMSNYDLHDIGMSRGEVAFGIAGGRGVFRDVDR